MRANDPDQLTGGELREIRPSLLLGAVEEDALRADAVVGAEHRAERRRGLAQLHRDEDFFLGGQPESAVLLGNREPKEPDLFHLVDDCGGNLVGCGHVLFGGHESLGHESPNGGEHVVENGLVADHAGNLTT